MKRRLTVGVIGGLGPAATLDFFGRLLARTPAVRDEDHLHVLIDNRPQVPNRNRAIAGTGPSPGPMLAEMAMGLERAGAELLTMPCNAGHAWADEIRAAVRIPLLSMIEETADAVVREHPNAQHIGLLAADACVEAQLYQAALAKRGRQALVPAAEDQAALMTLIYRIKGGETGPSARAEMSALAERLVSRGADLILAGCTEVPLVLGSDDISVPLLDATEVLADHTVRVALGGSEPSAKP